MLKTRKFSDERVFMNTRIRITVYSDEGTIKTREKINEAYNQFDSVVNRFTRFADTSELSQLNAAPNTAFKVSAELFGLVEKLLYFARISNGSFDPTIIDLLETYGFDKNMDFTKLENKNLYEELKQILKIRPSYQEIKLDQKNSTIQLAPRQRLDLGSIGKGYAIDLAYNVLELFPAFIINAGGDIRVKTSIEKPVWDIGLMETTKPNKSESRKILGKVELRDKSLAGSGGWARRVKFFHHLLSPLSGLPINEISQTYAIADSATDADGWATMLFTLGTQGLILAQKNNIEALVIDHKGIINKTDGFIYS